MNTRVCLTALAVMWLGSLPAAAQSDEEWRPGYVVLENGEELHGELRVVSERAASTSVTIRLQDSGEIVTLGPSGVERYGFHDGPSFFSHFIEAVTTTVFARRLVEGPLTLYGFHFPGDVVPVDLTRSEVTFGGEHYLVTDDEGADEVLLHVRFTERDRGVTPRTDRRYRQTLAEMMEDCEELQSRIRRLPMGRLHMVELIADYAACRGTEAYIDEEAIAGRSHIALRVGARAGVGLNRLVRQGASNDPVFQQSAALVLEMRHSESPKRVGLAVELQLVRRPTGSDGAEGPFLADHFDRPILALSVGARIPLFGNGHNYMGLGLTGGRIINNERLYLDRYWRYRFERGAFLEIGRRPPAGPGATVGLRLETSVHSPRLPSRIRATGEHRHTTASVVVGYGF